MKKPFYKKIRVVLWENRAKNTQDSRNEKIFKIGHLAKAIAHPKAIALQNGQFGSKIKNAKKKCETPFYKKIRVVLWENRAKNTQDSRNEKILKTGHLAKAIAHPKAIALQNGQFGSKIKNAKNMRKLFYKKIKVVL